MRSHSLAAVMGVGSLNLCPFAFPQENAVQVFVQQEQERLQLLPVEVPQAVLRVLQGQHHVQRRLLVRGVPQL